MCKCYLPKCKSKNIEVMYKGEYVCDKCWAKHCSGIINLNDFIKTENIYTNEVQDIMSDEKNINMELKTKKQELKDVKKELSDMKTKRKELVDKIKTIKTEIKEIKKTILSEIKNLKEVMKDEN